MPALAPAHITTAPIIDGVLDDAVWQTVPASDKFTQSFPRDGDHPGEHTSVRVAYDADNLYVAIDCEQTARPVVRLTRRDRDIDGDRVVIDLDTAHDHRSAFHFAVSAAGVMIDGLHYNDTDFSSDWDEVWQAEVAHTQTGWSAELRIPLRILRLRDGVDTWGFQVGRTIGATGEQDEWAYSPRDAGGGVSRFGELGPFENVAPRGSLALVPFVLARYLSSDLPSEYSSGASASAGIDATWRPANNITLQGALYPDFGQVEADQIVINLTTTEIEYPEKRPFFLQGMDVFLAPIQLVYTRRVGLATPVTGAAKLIATAGSIDVGALSVATDDTSNHVLRVRGHGDGFTVGALGTAQVQGAHDVETGGVDAAWRSSDGAWTANGMLAGSHTQGGPQRLLLDGTLLSPGDAGVGGTAFVAKEGGTLRGSLLYEGYSRKFEINDLGYNARQNVQHVELDLEAYSAKPAGPLVEERSRIELFYRRNNDGLVLPGGYQWNLGGTGRGLWQAWAELHWRPRYFDDRELGDGRALERSGRLGFELELSSDPRRAVIGSWSSALRSTAGGWEYYQSGGVKVRPRDNVELEADPDITISRGEPRFVDASDPTGPRFARLYATSFGITTRATWTLERDLTLQAYVQALLASLEYRDAFVADPALHTIALEQLQHAAFDPSQYDHREGVLDATIVARWEYRPGSVAYLVYSHAQQPLDYMAGDTRGFAPSALVRGPASDAVLLKLSWAWLR